MNTELLASTYPKTDNGNWLCIEHEYNKELNSLEILAVGEWNGEAIMQAKAITKDQLVKWTKD